MDNQNNNPRIDLARKMARKLLADIGIKNPPILIRDVVEHIKKEKDLSVYPWAFGKDTDGIQITQEESATIGYNQAQHQHRQRFTVAHEIGHFILGHTRGNFILDLNSKKPEEIEANQFAAELLMPLKMFKKDFLRDKNVATLARLYNVSEEAIWWRINDCRLLSKF